MIQTPIADKWSISPSFKSTTLLCYPSKLSFPPAFQTCSTYALRTMNGICSDDNHHQVDDSSNDVQWLLDRVNIFERSPKGLLEAWQLAQQSRPNSTTRIFFYQGKFAWLAYHLSKAAADQPTHFTGQSHLRRKISDLEKNSSAYRTSIAEKLEAELGSDVRDKIKRWWTTSNRQRATKRRRMQITTKVF